VVTAAGRSVAVRAQSELQVEDYSSGDYRLQGDQALGLVLGGLLQDWAAVTAAGRSVAVRAQSEPQVEDYSSGDYRLQGDQALGRVLGGLLQDWVAVTAAGRSVAVRAQSKPQVEDYSSGDYLQVVGEPLTVLAEAAGVVYQTEWDGELMILSGLNLAGLKPEE